LKVELAASIKQAKPVKASKGRKDSIIVVDSIPDSVPVAFRTRAGSKRTRHTSSVLSNDHQLVSAA
jgi:hypothetical protein